MEQKLNKSCKSYQLFHDAINRPTTLITYSKGIDHFMRFHKLTDYDFVAKQDADTIQDWLEAWVISQKRDGLKHTTIVGRLNGVELFLDMNKRVWYRKIVRKLLPHNDEQVGGDVPFTTEEVYRMRLACKKPRDLAILDFLASTGIRPKGVEDPILRIKHLVDMPHPKHVHSIPNWCYAIKIYDESKEGFWAFLHPEARTSMDRYLQSRQRNGEKLTSESPLFTTYENEPYTEHNYMSVYSIRRTLERLLKAADIERTKVGQRYDKAIVYGFRKRFNGILKMNNNVNSNIAEKLMSHKNGLDGNYLKPTREECYREFVKAIFELTTDPAERQKIKIKNLEEEKSELELLNNEKEQLLENYKKLEARTGRLERIAESTQQLN